MSNVSITDTVYNITVSETNSSVTVSSGDAITVLVDTFTISTNVVNSGSGASVGKEITGDTLVLRSISAGDDIVVTQNTDDITIALGDNIDANLTGDTTGHHFGNVTGNVTGNLTGDVVGDIDSNVSSINEITDVAEIRNAGNITINSTIDGFLFASVGDMYVGSLSQAAHISGTEIKSIGTTLEITGNLTGDVSGDVVGNLTGNVLGNVTGQVSDISNHTTTDLAEGDNLYYTQARFDTAFSNKTTTDLTEGTNLYWTQARFDTALSNITTDDVTEGSNLYYTDARVNTVLGNSSVDIIPATTSTYDLGSTTNTWAEAHIDTVEATVVNTTTLKTDVLDNNDADYITVKASLIPDQNYQHSLGTPSFGFTSVYIGPGSLYVDGQKVLGSDETGAIDMTTDAGQNLNISSGADIQFLTQANASGTQAFTVNLTDINLGPVNGTGTTTVNGTLEAPDLHIGDLELEAGLINYTQTGQNLEIRTNSAYLHANVSDLYVGPLTGAVKIDENTISSTVGDLTITGDLVGDVTGTVSDISNHTTTDLTEGTNLYYTDARVDARIPTNISAFTNDSGYITDYTVTESDVTQHQAALSITESQISDLQHYTDTDARNAISLTSTNTSELSYDSATGVFSYVSPSTVTASNAVTLAVRNASGVTISKGQAVYISGHSGNKVLVALAENDVSGKYPAIGLASGTMLNNNDGQVTVYGELAGVNTSAYSVGDVLYLGSTAGGLTNVRPSAETNAVQNIGKVARADSNGIIIISGSGRANDVPNLDHLHVFIGDTSGYEVRQLDTSDILEDASNLFYTDARVDARIPTNVSAFTNDAGYLTSYTETDPIYTASSWYSTTNNAANWDTAYGWGDHSVVGYLTDLSGQTTSNLTEGSNLYFTDARAISAVQGEATLDLTGDVSIAQDLDVSGLIKVNDGFTLSSFNPYAGFGGTTMPTTVMGVGQESGWAGMTIRSRGEHDWGLGAYGIQPDAPRSLLVLQGGRLDGSNDDYLNSGDLFGQMMFNPYSGYRTGVEWLTPSASIEATATQDHWQGGTAGFGTKLRLWTTKDGDFGGETDAQHAKSWIDIQGETITTSGTLKLDDDVQITGELTGNGAGTLNIGSSTKITGNAASKTTTIGDSQVSNLYDIHGFKIEAGDTAWASVTLDEHVGGNDKPAPSFSNPVVLGQVWGGTPSAQEAVPSGKRLITIAGQGSYDDSGTIVQPSSSPFRMLAETTQQHTASARGTKFQIETTPDGSTTRNTVVFQGDTVNINSGGGDGVIRGGNNLRLGSTLDTNNNNIINSGGDVVVDDNLQVNNDLTVDGTTRLNGDSYIGNDNTADFVQINARVDMNGLFGLINVDTATAQYYAGLENQGYITINAGTLVYVTDGDSGNPCIGVYNGSSWKRIALGSDISSS